MRINWKNLVRENTDDIPHVYMEYTTSRWFYFNVIKDLIYRDIY